MGERSACRPHPEEVSIPHPIEVRRPHPVEVSRPHPVDVSRPHPVKLSQVSSTWPVQVSLAGLTTYAFQLRKVITSSPELRFGCSWTLWKAH